MVKLLGTPYLSIQAKISVKAYRNPGLSPSLSIDAFVDELVKGEDTVFSERDIVISTSKLSQLKCESKCLPIMNLFRFDDHPCEWPDFIQNWITEHQ